MNLYLLRATDSLQCSVDTIEAALGLRTTVDAEGVRTSAEDLRTETKYAWLDYLGATHHCPRSDYTRAAARVQLALQHPALARARKQGSQSFFQNTPTYVCTSQNGRGSSLGKLMQSLLPRRVLGLIGIDGTSALINSEVPSMPIDPVGLLIIIRSRTNRRRSSNVSLCARDRSGFYTYVASD